MCFVHFASICFMLVATFPAFIFLTIVALHPHPPPYFWPLFLFALVLWYCSPSLPPPHLSVFYASPLPFLSFFLPTTTSAMCLYALGDLCIDTYICSFYAASVLFFFAFTTSLFYHISLSIPFTAASHSTTAPFYSFY